MPFFTKDDLKVYFVHIPKTGGSSVRKIFTDNNWKMHGAHNQNHITNWSHYVKDDIKLFTIIREPIDRILSEIRGDNWYRDKNTDINSCVESIENLIKNNNTKANHLTSLCDFIPVNLENCVKIFRFEDPNHREKIKNYFNLKGEYPHVTGDTYDADWGYELSTKSREKIKQLYKSDYDRFY